MAQKAKNNSRVLWYIIGGGAVFGVVWALTAPDNKPATTHKPSTSHAFASNTPSDLRPEDYTVRFASIKNSPKDAFKPLIYRKPTGGASANAVNAIPADFAGGESDWAYTGTGEIDGASQASFENSKSGEAAFVRKGEHWKKATVDEVGDDFCVVSGPSGTKRLELPVDTVVDVKPVAQAAPVQNQFAPVSPMNGAIGGMAAQADGSGVAGQDFSIQVGGGGPGGGFRGGRRGGRGGRGGGNLGGRGGGAPAPAAPAQATPAAEAPARGGG